MSNKSDSELIVSYVSGNEHCLELLIKKYKSPLYNFILSKVSNRELSDEIFQDTFIKVIYALKSNKYKHKEKFFSWLMKISQNLIYDHFRLKKRMVFDDNLEYSLEDDSTPENNPQEIAILKVKQDNTLNALVDSLSEDLKSIIKLRMFDGLSFKEIAKKENISINTATGRMRYALINLRKKINQYQTPFV